MKINNKIKVAIARYFANRDKQYKDCRVEGTSMTLRMSNPDVPRWDKPADQKRIDEACQQSGLSVSMASGTFWISNKKGTTVRLDPNNYLDDGIVTHRRFKPVK